MNDAVPLVSVIMPVFNGRHFLPRAIESLRAQSYPRWELIAIDDGSTDSTSELFARLTDERVRCHRLEPNRGLGAALNVGLEEARGTYIAYLPCDDVFYRDHLTGLVSCLQARPEAPLVYSGVRHHYNRTAPGRIDGFWLQLVQVAHRYTDERWTEREELVTDDLERMFWSKLGPPEHWAATGEVTCEWVNHPAQRYRVLQEPEGGINPYRIRYGVAHPLRFHTTTGNRIDEVELYRRFRERPDTPMAADGLKILLVGELAYNPERVLALEERGHRLYGLWMSEPYWYNTVGPVPFGHVEDLPRADWQGALRRLQPDVIYALLNWQAVPFAWEVLRQSRGVPFVWHFKEGPFICMEKGSWPQLVDLYLEADGRIYTSPEMRDWFATVVPGMEERRSLVLDGDLPKHDWFAGDRSPLLSERDGQPHTVVSGRPIGLTPERVEELARRGVHLHFYGDFTHGQWEAWIRRTRPLAPDHLHLHPQVDQQGWVREFSQYDAGWLHFFRSENRGEIRRANWDDLNYPARLATYAVAGLPVLQARNDDAVVATQNLTREFDLGLSFTDMEELAAQLHCRSEMNRLRENVWRRRLDFAFDTHVDRLIQFFRDVVQRASRA